MPVIISVHASMYMYKYLPPLIFPRRDYKSEKKLF